MDKKLVISFQLIFLLFSNGFAYASCQYEWAIIGAGPAGITALVVLLETGVDPATIIWIDPEFNVGRMGMYYRNVSSNTKIKQLIAYIQSCSLFNNFESPSKELLLLQDYEAYLPLSVMVDPLLDATTYLQSQVACVHDTVQALDSKGDTWIITANSVTKTAHKVILATGSHPKELDYAIPQIPLDHALDNNKLAIYVAAHDTIAVFGGMHSAMIILKYLSELKVHKVINFYTTPYYFRIPGAESLEGITEWWVKNILEKDSPKNLLRIENTQHNREQFLPLCNKVIYAIGYERNLLLINGSTNWEFDEKTRVIAPNLYGIGIAFARTIALLNKKKVAINGFSMYLSDARHFIPQWKR